MFGKTFLVSISVISSLWIGYVAYDLLNDEHLLHPEVVFSEQDGDILIVNRSQELDASQLDFKIPEKSQALVSQLLASTFPNEQLFISQKRNLILVKNTRFWTSELLKQYLNHKNVSYQEIGDHYLVNSTYELSFNKNNLLFKAKNESLFKHDEQEWPLWDPLASASIIHLNKPLKSTNIYFKADGTIAYETNIGNEVVSKKVDDGDLFSQELPANCSNYHFIEKEYAVKLNYLKKTSPLYEWMEDGFVLFDYQGAKCLMSDNNKMTEASNLLPSANANAKYETDVLSQQVNYFENGFYLDQVGDKIILSSSKETLNKITADYQLGNTLALDETAFHAIFARIPKKVSERRVESTQKIALSTYKNLIIKTVLNTGSTSDSKTIATVQKAVKENYASFGIQGDLVQLLGGQSTMYTFSNTNRLLSLQQKKVQLQFSLDGSLMGEVKELDVFNTGTNQVLFNTKNSIYLIDSKGSSLSGFPLEIPCSNVVSTYKWNNKSNFLVVNINNELLQIDDKGRILKKLKLNCGEVKNEVDVYRSQGKLMANVRGEKEFVTVDLDRNKILKKHPKIEHNSMAIKVSNGFDYYWIDNKGLQRINSVQQYVSVLAGTELKNLKRIKLSDQQFITCHNGTTIFLIDQNGMVKKIALNIQDIEDYDILMKDGQVKALAVLDGVQNKISILNSKGQTLSEQSFDGKNKVKLSMNGNQVNLTTSLQNNLIQYFDVIK